MADEALYNDQTTTEAEYARQLDAGRVQRQRSALASAAQQGAEQATTAAVEAIASRAGVQGYVAVRVWKFLQQHKNLVILLFFLILASVFLTMTPFLVLSYASTHPREAWGLGLKVFVTLFFPNFTGSE